MNRIVKSIIEISDLPDDEESDSSKKQPASDYHHLWSKNTAAFMGIPIDEILPDCVSASDKIAAMDRSFMNEFHGILSQSRQSFQMIDLLGKKILSYSKLYCYAGKKILRADDMRMMIDVFARSFGPEEMKTLAKLMRTTYKGIKREMDSLRVSKKLDFPYRHPSLSIHEDSIYPHGQGSYGQSHSWVYGKQSYVEYTNIMAKPEGKAIHPFLLIEMHLSKTGNNGLSVESGIIGQSFSIDGSGNIEKNTSNTLSYAWQDYLEEHMKSTSSWAQSTSKDGIKKASIEIAHPKVGIPWFSAVETSMDSQLMFDTEKNMQIFLGKRKKIGHLTYADTANDDAESRSRRLLEFLGRYIASEIVAYGYASHAGMSTPHCCEVPPNGNPWLSFRVSGRISSVPSISTGQSAYPDNYLSLPNDSEDQTNGYSPMRVDWTQFQKETYHIVVQPSVTRFMHDAFNYHVDVRILPNGSGAAVVLFSDSFNFIDEMRVTMPDPDRATVIGQVALANAVGIRNSPTYDDLGCKVLPVPIALSEQRTASRSSFSVGAELSVFESMPRDFISYHINSASTVMYKTSDMSQLRGNITNALKMFNTRTIDQNNLSSFISWNDFGSYCGEHFIENFNDSFMKSAHAYFTPASLQSLLKSMQQYFSAHQLNDFGIHDIPEVKEKNENTFVSLSPKTLLKTSSLSNGLSYAVYLVRHVPHQSVTESMIPIEKTMFNSLFSFYMTCVNPNGHEICVYQPSFNMKAGNYPRYASLADIVCGYFPDFICWMTNEGLRLHKSSQISSASYARIAEMHKVDPASVAKDIEMPFSPDASMISGQKEIVRRWITYHFPSLAIINQSGPRKGGSIVDHLMESALAVDTPRGKDNYSPSESLNDENVARLLRLAMLLHDVGRSFPSEGGVGPVEKGHAHYSAALARTILSQFYLKEREIAAIEKWIYHHDIFEKAVMGAYGTIDEASLHIAKIAETIDDAEILYHVYRCDTDFLGNYQTAASIRRDAGKPLLDAGDILDRAIQYITSSTLSKVSLQRKRVSRTFQDVGTFWSDIAPKDTNSEKVIRSLRIGSDYEISSRPINRTAFSPEYLLKAEAIIKDVNKNTDASFARAFGMSYDGNTGRIARCFHWASIDTVQTIFLEGMMPYASIDGRSIYASVNSASPLPVPLYNDDYVALVVFDYHCGNIISKKSLELLSKQYVQWKKAKLGTSVFSLSRDENDLIDNAKVGLDLGYASSLDSHAGKKILCCFDTNRIALITAMAVPMKVATKDLSPSFKGSPLDFYGRAHTGQFRKIALPELSYEDLKIEEANDLWLGDINE